MWKSILRAFGIDNPSKKHPFTPSKASKRDEKAQQLADTRTKQSPGAPIALSKAVAPARRGEKLPSRPGVYEEQRRVTPKKGAKASSSPVRWYGPDDTISIGQFRIQGPLTYGAKTVPVGPDRTAIDIGLPVLAPKGQVLATNAQSYASYRDFTPLERGAYLQWLSIGRAHPPDHPAFMPIFIEGVERRLILDRADGNVLVAELIRLLSLCQPEDGVRPHIYRLIAYALATLDIAEILQPALDSLAEQLEVKNNMTVDLAILGWLALRKRPASGMWVHRLLWRLRVPRRLGTTRDFASRREDFLAAFGRAFPEGYPLISPIATRTVSYYPTSSAVLDRFEWSSCPTVAMPDALTCPHLEPVLALWQACTRLEESRRHSASAVPSPNARPIASDRIRSPGQHDASLARHTDPQVRPRLDVVLNTDAVRKVIDDTKAVQHLLAAVFDEQESSEAAPKPSPDPVSRQAGAPCAVGLPERYQPILQVLLTEAEWERVAFVALARRHHLMPEDTIASINLWAEESLGELLIEESDRLYVHADLVRLHG